MTQQSLSITAGGLLDPRRLKAWLPGQHARIREAVGRAMNAEGRDAVRDIRAHMDSAFDLRGRRLPGSVRHKVFKSKPEQLPALYIGSKVPWLGAHERGGAIRGPL